MSVHDLPAVNASLNAVAGILLLIGYILIRSGRRQQRTAPSCSVHLLRRRFSLSVASSITPGRISAFMRQGFRPLYFTVLITHVTLAAVVLPLAILTLTQG